LGVTAYDHLLISPRPNRYSYAQHVAFEFCGGYGSEGLVSIVKYES
jgi:hypothetical protein